MRILEAPTRHLFFTGKGGVGKTSAACAVAVALADRGKSVLIVSTDPASNLDEVFGTSLAKGPVPIPGVRGLHGTNVDPEAAAAAYRERVVGPYRSLLPADAVASIEEQLSGACTVEIAAFDEFAKLLGDASLTSPYDHIVFDTAPTGHTLRLLALPAAWSGFIDASTAGTSCIGPLQGMLAQRSLYAAAVATLSDPARTTMVLVSRPDRGALEEAERTSAELADLGVRNQSLVLNGVFPEGATRDAVAQAMQRVSRRAVASMPARLAALERTTIALKPRQVLGVEALRAFLLPRAEAATPVVSTPGRGLPSIDELVDA
jgi:arsenite-transporting ATPase